MDPQVKSILTTVIGYGCTAAATWMVGQHFIPASDQATFATDMTALAMGGGMALIAWLKARFNSQKAMIKAVNDADNGVKVVAKNAEAQQVNVPLKAIALLALIIVGAAAFGPSRAVAADAVISSSTGSLPLSAATVYGLSVFDNSAPHEIAELGKDGCIKGPFKVYGQNMMVLFSLDAGVDYPGGCSKK